MPGGTPALHRPDNRSRRIPTSPFRAATGRIPPYGPYRRVRYRGHEHVGEYRAGVHANPSAAARRAGPSAEGEADQLEQDRGAADSARPAM